MSFARFRNLKIRRANQAAEYPCMNGVQEVGQSIDELQGAVGRLEWLLKAGKRVDDEMNCAERDKHIRLAEFKKRMVTMELVTAQRTLAKHGMEQVDAEEYESIKAQGKRPSPEQKAEFEKEMTKQSADIEQSETTLADMQASNMVKQTEAHNEQLRQEVEMLKSNLASLQKELESQKTLTLDVTMNKIQEEEARRERERAKRQKVVY